MRPFNSQTVGTCSLCRGAVTIPVVWWGVVPPTPSCSECGAHPRTNHGPVIDMEPAITSSTVIIDSKSSEYTLVSDAISFLSKGQRSTP